jgi:hypothetical protein
MIKFIKINLYKVDFVSDQNGNMVGRENGDTEPLYIAEDKILGIKPNIVNGHEDCYVLVLDMPEPLHVKDTFSELNNLINS